MAGYDPKFICDDRPEAYEVSDEIKNMPEDELAKLYEERFGKSFYE